MFSLDKQNKMKITQPHSNNNYIFHQERNYLVLLNSAKFPVYSTEENLLIKLQSFQSTVLKFNKSP